MNINGTSFGQNGTWVIVFLISIILLCALLTRLFKNNSHSNRPESDKDELMSQYSNKSKKGFEEALNAARDKMIEGAMAQFQKELKNNMQHLNEVFVSESKRITETIDSNLRDFQAKSTEIIEKSRTNLEKSSSDVDEKINQAIILRKNEAINAVELRMNKILASYLNKSLEGAISLSDQEEYIIEKLDANKEIIIRDINNA
jgi:hypothetical protein